MELLDIEKKVNLALDMLFARDSALLTRDSSEWSIAHRLAVYLEQLFPGWNVDCEYNRQGSQGNTKKESDGKGTRPDIAIHHRGQVEPAHNLLVIEIKKMEGSDDLKKVLEYTSPAQGKRMFQYQYGLTLSLVPFPNLSWFNKGAKIQSRRNQIHEE